MHLDGSDNTNLFKVEALNAFKITFGLAVVVFKNPLDLEVNNSIPKCANDIDMDIGNNDSNTSTDEKRSYDMDSGNHYADTVTGQKHC